MADAPQFTEITLLSLVLEAEPEFYDKQDCYEFSNGRKFKENNDSEGGVYE